MPRAVGAICGIAETGSKFARTVAGKCRRTLPSPVEMLGGLRRRLFARLYDRLSASGEIVLAPLRRDLVGAAHGSVLEIGAGTGMNLPYYAPDVELTAFEPNPWMAAQLERKAGNAGRPVHIDV